MPPPVPRARSLARYYYRLSEEGNRSQFFQEMRATLWTHWDSSLGASGWTDLSTAAGEVVSKHGTQRGVGLVFLLF